MSMLLLESQLNQAIALAYRAHQGQLDKAGQAYILHPLRVMQRVSTLDAKIVAILHDTLEDTWLSYHDLHQLGLSPLHLDAVWALTKQPSENRFQVLKRTLLQPLACEVKRADIYDNMNLLRLTHITAKDLKRYQQYHVIAQYLEHACSFYQRLDASLNPTNNIVDIYLRTSKTLLALAMHIYRV